MLPIIIAAKVEIKFCYRMCFICEYIDVTSFPDGIVVAILHEQTQIVTSAAYRVDN